MPSIAPLTPDQIADLYGAVNELVGTGDGSTKNFQLDYYPTVEGRTTQDEFVGVGDNVQTNYQLQYYPVTSGTLALYRTSVATANQLNPPSHVTPHYTVVEATGAVTLTVAGVAFLGTEQLHAAYSVPSTLELHKTSISGPLLIPTTDYTVVSFSGAITLTDAGVASLGTENLYAKYQIVRGLVNVLMDANASLRGGLAESVVGLAELQAKDDDLRLVHESIEKKTLYDPLTVPPGCGIEMEKQYEFQPFAVLYTEATSYVAVGDQVTEARIVNSVANSYKDTPANAPLYPESSPYPPNTRQPDLGKPNYSFGLTGGNSPSWNQNEEYWLGVEVSQYGPLCGHPDTPPRTDRYNHFNGSMRPYINAYMNVLNTYVIPALQHFISVNPDPTEYVSAQDLVYVQTALTNATNFKNNTASWVALVDTLPNHDGLANSYVLPSLPGTRYTEAVNRQAYLTGVPHPNRYDQVKTFLTKIYNARFFWITMRAAIGTGTLYNVFNTQKGQVSTQAQIADNSAKIAEVMLVIGAQ